MGKERHVVPPPLQWPTFDKPKLIAGTKVPREATHDDANTGRRHCERSEAIQSFFAALDCFVASLLAMTERG
jgi:hypothetical protein